jgi:hypothetical protein
MTSVGRQPGDGLGPKAMTSHDVGLVGLRRASNEMIRTIRRFQEHAGLNQWTNVHNLTRESTLGEPRSAS